MRSPFLKYDIGQNDHTDDVDGVGVDQAVLVLSGDVVGDLVDHVHQDSGQAGHHEVTVTLLSCISAFLRPQPLLPLPDSSSHPPLPPHHLNQKRLPFSKL